MKSFFIGVIVGIVIATVGLSGLFRIMDNGLNKVQTISKEAAQ